MERRRNHKKFRSYGQVCSNWLFLCSPADRHCTACCGHLVPTDSIFVPLQTDTAQLVAAIWFQPTVFFFPCRRIQHDSLRPFGSNRQYFCSPADRYCRTRCGQLVPTDRISICPQTDTAQLVAVSFIRVVVSLQTDRPTAGFVAVIVFHVAVFWFALTPIQYGLVWPLCFMWLCFGLPSHRYSTALCGHCVPCGCVLVCPHTDTARPCVAIVFQTAVFWSACRLIQRGLMRPVCYIRLYYGSAYHVTCWESVTRWHVNIHRMPKASSVSRRMSDCVCLMVRKHVRTKHRLFLCCDKYIRVWCLLYEIMPVAVEVTNCDNWTNAILHKHAYCAVQSNL